MKEINLFFFGRRHASTPWKTVSASVNHRIYYVYGGTAFFTGHGNRIQLRKGHLYVIPYLGNYTYLEQDDNDPLHLIALDFSVNPTISPDGFSEIKVDDDEILKLYIKTIEAFYPNEPVVLDCTEFHSEKWQRENTEFIDFIKVFISYIIDHHNVSLCTDMRIAEAVRIISENYDSDISIQEIAEKLGMNAKYFITLFRQHITVTPYQYIIMYRMSSAERLMEGGSTVSEAAYNSGFSDTSAFCNAYKKIRGISPGEFLRCRAVENDEVSR